MATVSSGTDPLSPAANRAGEASLDRYAELLRSHGFERVAGADEAGRGALAGPLVAAAVILPADFATDGIDDSKRLGPAEREEAFERIMGTATAVVSIRRMRPATIDRRGLHRCNLALLRKAVEGLEPEPDYVLTDGFPVPGIRFPALGVKKGDAVSATVAAASILAKVTRDRVMDRLARTYPEFGFDHNRGYGTPDHLDALDRLGPTPEHRLSFSCVGQPKLPGFAPLEIATQLPPDGEVVPA